jgi:hypothetical protein
MTLLASRRDSTRAMSLQMSGIESAMSGAMRSLKHAVSKWRRLALSVIAPHIRTIGGSNKSTVRSSL